MKLTKSQLKQIIKEELEKVLNPTLILEFKEEAYSRRWASVANAWLPEHISENNDLWLAAYRAHINPNPTPEDTKIIQQLQMSLSAFDAGENGKFGENMNVPALIQKVLEKTPQFIPGALD